MLKHDTDPSDFDDGVRDAVVLLWKGGFRTFTSCEGGRGHSFQHETIGLKSKGPTLFSIGGSFGSSALRALTTSRLAWSPTTTPIIPRARGGCIWKDWTSFPTRKGSRYWRPAGGGREKRCVN